MWINNVKIPQNDVISREKNDKQTKEFKLYVIY